jgi:hypothetical protein
VVERLKESGRQGSRVRLPAPKKDAGRKRTAKEGSLKKFTCVNATLAESEGKTPSIVCPDAADAIRGKR